MARKDKDYSQGTKNIEPYKFEKGGKRPSDLGKIGGKKSGEVRRNRRAIAESLRILLAETAPGTEMTKQDFIIAKALAKLSKEAELKDVKMLAEILGELKVTAESSGALTLNVQTSKEGASLINKIVEGEE